MYPIFSRPVAALEGREVLVRWRMTITSPAEQRRVLREHWRALPANTRSVGGVRTCYASRQPGEVWLTFFVALEHAEPFMDSLRPVLGLASFVSVAPPPGFERRLRPRTNDPVLADPLLGSDLSWYRQRLHQVTDIALTIDDDLDNLTFRLLLVVLETLPDPALMLRQDLPMGLYEGELRRRLVALAGPAMDRATQAGTDGAFWTDFLRRPHRGASVLNPPGHWLWNLLR
jgi:hypothetical protein